MTNSPPQLVWALNTVSGAVAQVSPHLLTHPLFGTQLVEVPPHTKSYEPELWKPTTAAEFVESQQKKTKDEGKK